MDRPLAPQFPRRSPWHDFLDGALLIGAWALVWSFLTLGVAAPLGRLAPDAPRSAVSQRAPQA